ncbi:hypothetical protein NW768_008658 [Fusarium equiseti]|uniref:Mid2 domain-containing protein n=1 Tax=Fusarium equiseti TaxID=61235 RepID=A0ABQ8R545_FUSEQ|nr:hypothetical protein NW768_008658 [Fusarium equiseti]
MMSLSTMAARRLFAFLALLSLGQTVLALFINPPPRESDIDNPQYELGQEIKIRWSTNADFTDLTLWQSGTGKMYTLQSNSKSQDYTWIVSYQGIDPAETNSFSLYLFEHGQTGPLFSSHRFNITDPKALTTSASETTTTSPSQTETEVSSQVTAETTSESASSSSTVVDGPSSSSAGIESIKSSGPSSGAIAGVVVGSIVVVLGIAVVGFMLWRRKKAKKASGSTPEMEAEKYAPVQAPHDNGVHQGPYEMGDPAQAHELPATEYNPGTGSRT